MDQLRFILFSTLILSSSIQKLLADKSTCDGKPCHPRIGNLVVGRSLVVNSTCGEGGNAEIYCDQKTCEQVSCQMCNDKDIWRSFPPHLMTDSTFIQPRTWWQSSAVKGNGNPVIIQLDLGAGFYLMTHLVVIFKSPRPSSMVIERSNNFGATWKPYAYYAKNCSRYFGMLEGTMDENDVFCTSRYSSPYPCDGGEVVFRTMEPRKGPLLDLYGEEARKRMVITNLRLTLRESQNCQGCEIESYAGSAVENPPPISLSAYKDYFAIYDLMIFGSCFCNGHAERCSPLKTVEATSLNKVHGKCMCSHKTAGNNCEQCLPLYNDAPWKPANVLSGEANECKLCECHNHADECYFDKGAYKNSNGKSGGVCYMCGHNTMGRQCEYCKPGYYADRTKNLDSPEICKACQCDAKGSVGPFCDANTGACFCKPGVTGVKCDRCLSGYYGFQIGNRLCRECRCLNGQSCDQVTGECLSSQDNSGQEMTNNVDANSLIGRHSANSNCSCEEDSFKRCKTNKYDYVVKTKVIKAYDDGITVRLTVKTKRVFKSGKVSVGRYLWPISWVEQSCTCPMLLKGKEYLVAGYEDVDNKRLVVDLRSFVHPWQRGSALKKMARQLAKNMCT